jgi:membrane protein YdbS with pleckstrin-like domain
LWTSDKSIPLDRVQDVEIQRSLIARILGLTQVEISSAGSGGNIKLSYFDLPDAERFRRLLVSAGLEASRAGDSPGPPVAERPLHAVSQLEILRTVVVGASVGSLALVTGVVLAIVVHPLFVIPGLALLALTAFQWASSWLTIGPGQTSVRGDLLHTRQGLITLRSTNTPLRRIQILGAAAGPVYQLLGAERVSFESADAAVASSERVRTLISPGARRGLAEGLITPILGVGAPTEARRRQLGDHLVASNAARWAFNSAVALPVAALVAAIPVVYAVESDGSAAADWLAVIAVVMVLAVAPGAAMAGALWGSIRAARSWYSVDADCLVMHDGVWRLRSIAVPLAKVQAVDLRTDPAQRRFGTATLEIDIAGVSGRWAVKLPDLDADRAVALRDHVLAVATRIALADGV